MKKESETLGTGLSKRVEEIAREVLEEYFDKRSELNEEDFQKWLKDKME